MHRAGRAFARVESIHAELVALREDLYRLESAFADPAQLEPTRATLREALRAAYVLRDHLSYLVCDVDVPGALPRVAPPTVDPDEIGSAHCQCGGRLHAAHVGGLL